MSAPHSATLDNKSPTRDEWLTAFVDECRGWFSQHGYHLPAIVHVRSGWGHGSGHRHAEAPNIQAHLVSGTRTRDGAPVIFVSPVVDDVERIVAYVVHQLCHALFDPDTMGTHPAAFRHAARDVGLEGKPTAPTIGPELRALLTDFIHGNPEQPAHGPYPVEPVGSLVLPIVEGRTSTAPAVQTDRYIAARCPVCPGHRTKRRTVKLSRRAASEGAPICGRILEPATADTDAVRCQHVMVVDEPGTGEG